MRHPVGGLVHRDIPAGERPQPAWLTFIAVSDAAAATRTKLSQCVVSATLDVHLGHT